MESRIAGVESVEPSFMITSSKSAKVCRRMLSTADSTVDSALWTGMRTEISGVFRAVYSPSHLVVTLARIAVFAGIKWRAGSVGGVSR